MSSRFRFGLQISTDLDDDPVSTARRAEELGFDIVSVSDHIGPGMAPLPTLAESVEIIRRLLDGERVDFVGDHYTVTGAEIDRTVQDHLPILIGGNGRALLEHAGAHADIVGFQGLGRTRSDGHRHAVKWDPAWLTAQVEQVRDGAGDRFDQLELNALAQVVQVTNDRSEALISVCARIEGVDPEHAADMPYLLVGTVDEIVEHIVRCDERWGITYFVVRELEEMAPIIAAMQVNRP